MLLAYCLCSHQELIEETARKMGAGMAKFILKEVETIDDYSEYCHIVSGLVCIDMSKLFNASNLEDLVPAHLSNSMGLILQKVDIIQDFLEDMNEIPKAHMHWPRQIWSKYVDKLEDLTYKENSEKAVSCLNDMVTDALSHAKDCLEYLSALRDPAVFRLCAIFQMGVNGKSYQVHQGGSSLLKEQVDPFSLVADELSLIGNWLRETVQFNGVPKLSSGYFFEMGVEGNRFRPMVLLLMASALNQCVAEITEMIHVASLLHDDVLDDADTRRGVHSLKFLMGNKSSVLEGDFLLCRACVTLASLKNTEVDTLLGTAVENLIAGEMMQMASMSEKHCSMKKYIQKAYYKTASLIANSCKAVSLLADPETEVVILAYNYPGLIDDFLDFTGTSASLGKGSLSDIRHGIITAPVLYAIEEFPQLQAVISGGLDDPADVDLALQYLGKSPSAINSFPVSNDDNVRITRLTFVDLTHMVITRTK
ncbi:hypothetical protein MKX01_002129 [Papaver californicum]|nr:hypothetical protein MKX01_002129 [Papaver californicum]